MTRIRDIPWTRIGVEASAIVVSILLAFAIDAWWDERQERQDEREQLSRLRVEFSANVSMIEQRTYEKDIPDASKSFFDEIEMAQSHGLDAIDVAAPTLVLMLAAPTFDADTPILNGLIRSGRLEIIRDQQVLAMLADWDRLLRDYTSFAERARSSVDSHLLPAMTLRGDIGTVLMLPTSLNRIDPDSFTETPLTIRIDDELQGLVAER